MIQPPVCTFKSLYDILCPSTEVKIRRLNDGKLIYKGEVIDSLRAFISNSDDYNCLVVAYNGIYNNNTTGTLDIEVWDLSILEGRDS